MDKKENRQHTMETDEVMNSMKKIPEEIMTALRDVILNIPLREDAPNDIKAMRESLRFEALKSLYEKDLEQGNEDACGRLFEILKSANDSIKAMYQTDSAQVMLPIPRKRGFRKGDRVRFKEWNEMVAEFGCHSDGDIPLSSGVYFVKQMKALCGAYATIAEVLDKSVVLKDLYIHGLAVEVSGDWTFTTEMLKHIPKE